MNFLSFIQAARRLIRAEAVVKPLGRRFSSSRGALHYALPNIVSAALLSDIAPGRGRSLGTSALWAAIAMLLSLLLCSPLTRQVDSASAGSSSGIYLAMAVNDAFCGRYPVVSSMVPVGTISVAEMFERPIYSYFGTHAGGSIKNYCAGKFQPYVINEISLAILEGYLLRAMPDASMFQLATTLAAIRVVLIGLFGFVLLRAGASIVFTFFLCLVAHYMTVLLGRDALFSQYPFVLPMMLCYVAGCATMAAWLERGQWLRSLGFAAVLGFAAAFAGNLRTTLYPMVAVGFCLAVLDYLRRVRLEPWRWLLSFSLVTIFSGALLAFEATYITPMRGVTGIANYAHHTIAHPLVLGLATPPSALAEREGIKFDDAIGAKLAQQIDSSARYLNPTYEAALLTYYAKLWFYFPKEMAQVYVAKWRVTGQQALEMIQRRDGDIFWTSKNGAALGKAIFPVCILSRVVGLPQVLLAVAIAGMLWSLRLNATASTLLISLSTIAFLGYIEAAVVLTGTTLWYSSVLLTGIIFIGLLTYQVLLDMAKRLIIRGA